MKLSKLDKQIIFAKYKKPIYTVGYSKDIKKDSKIFYDIYKCIKLIIKGI